MQGHGPDADAYDRASNMELTPQKIGEGSMGMTFQRKVPSNAYSICI